MAAFEARSGHGGRARWVTRLEVAVVAAVCAVTGAMVVGGARHPAEAPAYAASSQGPAKPASTTAFRSVPTSAVPRPSTPRPVRVAFVPPTTAPAPRAIAAPVAAPVPVAAPAPVAARTSAPAAPRPPPAPPLVASPPPAPAPVGPGYVFEHSNANGSPTRWAACVAIHYVVNLAEAPPSAASDVAGAIARLSQATGITLVDDGSTAEVPSQERPVVQASRYGQRWVPLLIAWTRPSESDYLPGGNVVGEGGNIWTSTPGGDDVYVTGQVAINADATRSLPAGFGAGTTIGLLLLHELGHAMGLGHVGDPSQVMYPDMVPRPSADYGAGDLRGLNLLGRGSACESEPATP